MAFRSAIPLGRGTDLRRPRQSGEALSPSPPVPAGPAVPFPLKPSPSHRCKARWATPVTRQVPSQPRHLPAACPPATELSGLCSLNAHFVPLSTGLIDINSCAQSAHSVFLWSDAVGVCVCDYIQWQPPSGGDEIWAVWTLGKWQSLLDSLKMIIAELIYIEMDKMIRVAVLNKDSISNM